MLKIASIGFLGLLGWDSWWNGTESYLAIPFFAFVFAIVWLWGKWVNSQPYRPIAEVQYVKEALPSDRCNAFDRANHRLYSGSGGGGTYCHGVQGEAGLSLTVRQIGGLPSDTMRTQLAVLVIMFLILFFFPEERKVKKK